MPRLRLIIAINWNRVTSPLWAASPESWAMPTGPTSCDAGVSRVSSPHRVRKINCDHSRFRSRLSANASNGPGSTTRTS